MSEILKEMHKNMTHPDGTYVSVKLSKDSQKKLDDWTTENKIPNASDPSEYHTTIIYSRKGIPDVKSYDLSLPITAKLSEWKIFNTQDGKKCLVGVVNSNEIKKHHEKIMKKYGGTYDFPEYIPHITVSYDYESDEIPSKIPNFDIVYDDKDLKPLNPDFIPPKKGK